MFGNLVASNPAPVSTRRRAATLWSVGVHGIVLLGSVVFASTDVEPSAVPFTEILLPPYVFPTRQEAIAPDATAGARALTAPVTPVTVPIISPVGIMPSVDLGPQFTPADLLPVGETPSLQSFFGSESGNGGLDGVYAVASVDERPVRLNGPEPIYPDLLRSAGISGHVNLEFVIDSAGAVDRTSIVVLAATNEHFVRAAVRSVLESRFRPARVKGRVVSVRVRQRIAFDIR